MEKSPNIEIIILNYNGWKDTIECLKSVLRNNYPNYQVIVVDNNSPNNSLEYIQAWAEGKQENLLPDPSHPLYHLSHRL
jgi:GT2 family glycosyltransferase